METNKKQRYLVLLVAFSMLLTFLPSFGIENVNAQSTAKDDAKYSEQKCYDGMCFEGEVEGNSLISYDKLIKDLNITTGLKPEIDKYAIRKYASAKEINKQYQDELSKGGMWLKFTDNKYARDGKPRTFYVAKKPILKGIAWNDIFEAGAIYGWDVIDPNTGKPIKDAEKYKNKFNNKYYKASMVTINGQKYIVRLLQGKTNYSGDVKNTKSYPDNNENANSEWNRVILPLTKEYRFGSSTKNGYYIESVLHEKDGDNYKNQIAQYNWFGDLTLGAYDKFTYNGKEIDNNEKGTGENGQCNWTQEYNGPNSRGYRGHYETTYGAAYSNIDGAGNNDKYYGFRPVLEPLEGAPGEVVDVTQTLNIKKTNPKGKPLEGVEFKINNDTYKTDSSGKVSIPIYKYSTGILTLKEQECTIGRITYKSKNIPINHVKQCYDGMCFEGEVTGNELGITYDELRKDVREKVRGSVKYDPGKELLDPSITESQSKLIYEQNESEKTKGGIWLKFTDYRYKKYNKPRTFYVAKKPILKNISWNDIHTAGMVYGWDVIDPNTDELRQNSDKYKNKYGNKDYKATILDNKKDSNKYIVRLLQGKTNYGGDVSNTKYYQYDSENANSEWNRTILPLTKEYRFGSSTNNNNYIESVLCEKNGDNYKNQTAQYNWFGDLTLGAWESFNYNNNNNVSSVSGQGQYNWVQEYGESSSLRSYRGRSGTDRGAAYSGTYSPDYRFSNFGFRPVLEPLTTNEKPSTTYDGMEFVGEVEGNSLISYEKLISDLGITEGSKPAINRSGYEEIYDNYEKENAKGGIWLKFIDHKYTRDGKPRTLYVMKKPARQGVSWDTLHTAGAVYRWDVIDLNTGLPKSSPKKYKNKSTNKDYKARIITINGQKYIVRLLQGKTNYGGDVSNTKYYQYDIGNVNSEWNRTILPITKDYRFGSRAEKDEYIESVLREKNGDSYKNQTAQYNWFGDLTLGADDDWNYNNKPYKGLSDNNNGQISWIQESGESSGNHSFRGSSSVFHGAAISNSGGSIITYSFLGVRLVLEPYNN